MTYEVTKTKVISSVIWKIMERVGAQGIQFMIMVMLARLLLPEDFGLIIIVSVFIAIAGVVVQGGFTTALIQKKHANHLDYSSVFFLNLVVAILLYSLLFISSPFIASFFKEPQLLWVLRILSLTLILGVFSSVQHAIISRNMQFKKLFLSSLVAVVVSGFIGISLAYANFGVWALVAQSLTSQLLVTVMLWFLVSWRPQWLFSIKRIHELFSFGWKLLVSGLLDTLYINLQSLIVGKMFSPAMLGFYNRGDQLPGMLVSNINGSIQSVMLPTLSSYQDDTQRVKEIMRRAIVTSSLLIFPMMVGVAVVAKPLVSLLFTDKWLPAVPFVQIFCAVYALWPIHTANLQAINALGRSDIFLKLEIIKKVLGLVILGLCIPFGVYAMAMGMFVGGVISTLINAYPNLKLLNYSVREQWNDLIPPLMISVIMGAIVYTIHWLPFPDLLTIIIQISVGIILYIGLAMAFKLESFTYLLLTSKELIRSKKKSKLIVKNEVQ